MQIKNNKDSRSKVAGLLCGLAKQDLMLDLTSNGEFTCSYTENRWSAAYKHLISENRGSLVVKDKHGVTLRMYFEVESKGHLQLCDFSSHAEELRSLAFSLFNETKTAI